MPRGRPTKYKAKYCDMVIEHMQNGASLTSFAASIGMYRDILYDWMDKNEDFRHACKTAQALSQQWWENFANQAATGRIFDKGNKGKYDKHNPNMIQFLMSRRFRDFNAVKQDQSGDANINIKLSYDKEDL